MYNSSDSESPCDSIGLRGDAICPHFPLLFMPQFVEFVSSLYGLPDHVAELNLESEKRSYRALYVRYRELILREQQKIVVCMRQLHLYQHLTTPTSQTDDNRRTSSSTYFMFILQPLARLAGFGTTSHVPLPFQGITCHRFRAQTHDERFKSVHRSLVASSSSSGALYIFPFTPSS